MMEQAGLATGLEVIGKAFGPAASMIFGQAERAILSATLGR